jgi:hypothetical protein
MINSIIAAIFAIALSTQMNVNKCQHPSNLEKWQAIRVLPVKVTYLDESKVTFIYEDKTTVLNSELELTKETIFKSREDYKSNRYLIYYCGDHLVLHLAEKLKDKK